jgi:pimeloyl-ACP methyl ester carboxylesterase
MMELQVNGHRTYCYTGGKAPDPSRPTIVLLHGALGDHSVWILQSRYLAHHGWNVLAVDLPGHCRSDGPPPATVEAGADFVLALLDAAGLQQAVLVGHSFGSLIALEAAGRAPQRVRQLVLVGTAFPMKVSPTLLQLSLDDPGAAIDMVNVFSRSTLAPPPSALGPGTWVFGGNRALMHHVMASNPSVNLFHAAFKACNDYGNGLAAMAAYPGPVLFALGRRDQMTPPRAAQALIGAAAQHRVAMLEVGHHQMLESPDALLAELRQFLKP